MVSVFNKLGFFFFSEPKSLIYACLNPLEVSGSLFLLPLLPVSLAAGMVYSLSGCGIPAIVQNALHVISLRSSQ